MENIEKICQILSDRVGKLDGDDKSIVIGYTEACEHEAQLAAGVVWANGILAYMFAATTTAEMVAKGTKNAGQDGPAAGIMIDEKGCTLFRQDGIAFSAEAAAEITEAAARLSDDDVISADYGQGYSFGAVMFLRDDF